MPRTCRRSGCGRQERCREDARRQSSARGGSGRRQWLRARPSVVRADERRAEESKGDQRRGAEPCNRDSGLCMFPLARTHRVAGGRAGRSLRRGALLGSWKRWRDQRCEIRDAVGRARTAMACARSARRRIGARARVVHAHAHATGDATEDARDAVKGYRQDTWGGSVSLRCGRWPSLTPRAYAAGSRRGGGRGRRLGLGRDAGRAEAAVAADRVVEVVDLERGRHADLLEDELRDAVSGVDCGQRCQALHSSSSPLRSPPLFPVPPPPSTVPRPPSARQHPHRSSTHR